MYRMTKHIGGNGNPAEQTYRHQNVNGDGPFFAKRISHNAIRWQAGFFSHANGDG